MNFSWREIGSRPQLEAEIFPCAKYIWPRFRSYHYMSADLVAGSRCYVMTIDGGPVAFAAILNFPHPKRHDIRRVHRVVVLPDWQGLGVGMILLDRLGAAHRAVGQELRIQTASANFARSLSRQANWRLTSSGINQKFREHPGRKVAVSGGGGGGVWITGFRYAGIGDVNAAKILLGTVNNPSLPTKGTG